jgi:hypothetical protein
MIQDMKLSGLASTTQARYIDAVSRLAAHFKRSPNLLSEEEVRAYLVGLRERGIARGTFKTNHYGIQFLYRNTLNRDWPLFLKKDPSAQAEALAPRAFRQAGSPSSHLPKEPDLQDLLRSHVCLRLAGWGGNSPRDPGDRR